MRLYSAVWKPHNLEFDPKGEFTATSQTLNNSWTQLNRRQASGDLADKIGIAESIDDVALDFLGS